MTAILNALAAARSIETTYRRYLATTFRPRRDDFAAEFDWALRDDVQLAKGPYLQATPPFVPGSDLRGLVDEGVLNPDILRLGGGNPDRPLYRHQEQAIRAAVARRNLIVATGTGSGKTESFLIPIIDRLLKEQEQGTLAHSGVRALLLYPMNALVNDQVKRLRSILAPLPEITFGRYIGETRSGQSEAELGFHDRFPGERLLANELISRDSIHARPPHILITNFAMLEYLLLRPESSTLFDGPTGRHWSTIVLDEAHVYDGAQGAEVAMLLRRVKDRVVGSEPGRIQAFATSATLGRGEDDYPALLEFGEALFGETFEYVATDPERRDIITASRKDLRSGEASHRLTDAEVLTLARCVAEAEPVATMATAVTSAPVPDPALDPGAWLHALLRHDERVLELQDRLTDGARPIDELTIGLVDDSALLVDLVNLCVFARPTTDAAPLLPARYHYFVRSLESANVCLSERHPDGEPRLKLARSLPCPACELVGVDRQVFELGVCRTCRVEYLVGLVGPGWGKLQSAPPNAESISYVLLDHWSADGDHDDEAAITASPNSVPIPGYLCLSCRQLSETEKPCCAERELIKVTRIDYGEADRLHRCPTCNTRAAGDVVTRFVTGSDAPASVLATSLYQALPPSSVPDEADEPGEGRRLLTFSDSRQDAAFFAPFFERTYRRGVERALMLQALVDTDEPLGVEDLFPPVRKLAESHLILDEEASRTTNCREVLSWITQEVLAFDRRLSLEGSGWAEIFIAEPRKHRTPEFLQQLGFDDRESSDLIQLLLLTVRQQGAVAVPDEVDIRHERFEPRNRPLGIRLIGSERGVLAWLPSAGTNARVGIVERVLAARGIEADSIDLLRQLWEFLTDPSSPWAERTWVTESKRSSGLVHRLNHDRIRFQPVAADHRPFRCDRCRRLWWRSVDRVCPGWRCTGRLSDPVELGDVMSGHYAALYQELTPTAISVSEHTAQWTSQAASEIQRRFTKGTLNVLSCSTTFELGVDVGDVEAVFLKNVPPSPANYVQRAGRAGRRRDSAALVVTFAQRRSHDLAYYADPSRLVNGVVEPPLIQLDNASIVRRHIHSVAFALFERDRVQSGRSAHRSLSEFFEPSEHGAVGDAEFLDWLATRPADLGRAITRVVPPDLAAELGLGDWSWAAALIEATDDEPTFGWLKRAALEARDDIEELESDHAAAIEAKEWDLVKRLERMLNTVRREQLIGYLSKKNVLPKYGFPVDVVQLHVNGSGSKKAADVDLSRDLKIAISEYAPGASVVAGGRLWTSEGLKRRPGLEWRRHRWAVCSQCGAFRHGGAAEPGTSCRHCHGTSVARGQSGAFIIPEFGFVGKDDGQPGQTRPPRVSTVRTYFGAYKDHEPAYEGVRVGEKGREIYLRTSRQGEIAVINRGSKAAGFQVCERCGHVAAADPGRGRRPRDHPVPGRPGRRCTGTLSNVHLGHRFLTDVLEIQLDHGQIQEALLSTMYALIEGSAVLGIPRDDLDGVLDGRRSVTAAALARQAIETALDDWLVAHDAAGRGTKRDAFLCLVALHPDPTLARQLHNVWAQLSGACHAISYELPPASSELERWMAVVHRFITPPRRPT